jgi:hypothetical protein
MSYKKMHLVSSKRQSCVQCVWAFASGFTCEQRVGECMMYTGLTL